MSDDLSHISVSCFTDEALNVLSRLNARRIISCDGPSKLPRDWRGLAYLVGINSQDIETQHQNMLKWTLEMWIEHSERATVQQLLQHLESLDRFDIKDDLLELAAAGRLLDRDYEMDSEGDPVYDALVLFAEADQGFISIMIENMSEKGFKLLPRAVGPKTNLVSARCRNTVLIYSPAFFKSVHHKFYREYDEHMRSIETMDYANIIYRLIPCIYKACKLPPQLQFYFPLYVDTVAYNFWDQLARAISAEQTPRQVLPSISSSIAIGQVTGNRSREPSNVVTRVRRTVLRDIASWYRRRTRAVQSRFYQDRSSELRAVELVTL